MNEYMNKAQEIINEWNDMTPEQQLKFCQVCVCKAIKRGRTLKPGWDLEDATQETYCKMLQRLADGETLDILDTVAATNDTEKAAIIRAMLTDFYNSLDSKDKVIFGGMMEGKTEREIAPTVEISNIAVHNRMVKIRAQLAEMV